MGLPAFRVDFEDLTGAIGGVEEGAAAGGLAGGETPAFFEAELFANAFGLGGLECQSGYHGLLRFLNIRLGLNIGFRASIATLSQGLLLLLLFGWRWGRDLFFDELILQNIIRIVRQLVHRAIPVVHSDALSELVRFQGHLRSLCELAAVHVEFE